VEPFADIYSAGRLICADVDFTRLGAACRVCGRHTRLDDTNRAGFDESALVHGNRLDWLRIKLRR
jgi:hypothetical protein